MIHFLIFYASAAVFTFALIALDAIWDARKPVGGRFGSRAPTLPRRIGALAVWLALAALWPLTLARVVWLMIFPVPEDDDQPMEFKRGPGRKLDAHERPMRPGDILDRRSGRKS